MRIAPWLPALPALPALAAIALAACGRAAPSPSPPTASSSTAAPPSAASAASAAPTEREQPRDARRLPDVLVTEPGILSTRFEAYDLGSVLGDARAESAAELALGAHYADLAATIDADVAAAKRADPASGVGLAFAHRLLDTRVLRDPAARWELVGVAQRFDRDFADASRCGELRFVYRLRYDKEVKGLRIASRMPATLAVSFWNAEPTADCGPVLRAFAAEPAFRAPPLAELARRFKSVELDVQTVRWPSTTRGDMAGHAEYALRALVRSRDGAHLVAGPLENTPDVPRARRDPSYRERLRAWIVEPANAHAIDAGRAILPPELCATSASDVTPHGLARRHNRPFRELFGPKDVVVANDAAIARSPEGVLRRLDQLSCPGCHASRSLGGFHLLGDETAPRESVNAVLVGRSPHLLGEIARRKAELARRIGLGGAPRAVPFADRTDDRGARGDHCALGTDPSFASWTCAPGLVCARDVGSDDDGVGVCADPKPRPGNACEIGRIAIATDPHRDRVVGLARAACPGACDDNAVGFPNGACVGSCDALGEGAVCGAIPRLVGFNTCLATSKTKSFEDCILANATPAAVQACDEAHACRDDYLCARTRSGEGACMPPYFLFQLRVDGHP